MTVVNLQKKAEVKNQDTEDYLPGYGLLNFLLFRLRVDMVDAANTSLEPALVDQPSS